MSESLTLALAIEHLRTALECLHDGKLSSASLVLWLSLSTLNSENGSILEPVRRSLAPFGDPQFAFFDEMADNLFSPSSC